MTEISITGETSPGVKRMQALSQALTRTDKIRIFISLFLIAYVYGLDGTLRFVYQPYATATFATHSSLATVNVLRNVVATATQPTIARLSDVFGRLQLVIASVILYLIGTVVEATCHGINSFIAGAVIYQIGYTAILLLVEVIIADVTSLRSRLAFSFVPALPSIINTWVSGDIGEAVLKVTTWRWGIGMWGIIYFAFSLPLMASLYIPLRRVETSHALATYRSPYQMLGTRRLVVALFQQLDIVGIILLIIIFALILAPLTVAGEGSGHWRKAKVVAPLVVGIICIPVWIIWERKTEYPLVPFKLLQDRGVWGALAIAWMLLFLWSLQADYLYTVLVVGFGESVKSATRIAFLYSFCSVITGFIVGLIVRFYFRYLRPFIICGAILFAAAFGMLIHYRGGDGSDNHTGIIGAQVLLGIAGGLVPYPTQTSIQAAAARPEHVAVITGLFLATYNIGFACGNAVSGAIWTQTMVSTLMKNLPAPYNDHATAKSIYENPFPHAVEYPMGTPLRDGIVKSYRHTQKLLTITGICLCLPLLIFCCCIRDPELGKNQSLQNEEVVNENGVNGTG